MKIVKTEFPNPILAVGKDDYLPEFFFKTSIDEMHITVDDNSICIPIEYELHCGGISDLILSGQAKVVVIVKSTSTSYCRLFTFPMASTKMEIKVPKYDVVKKIDVEARIIAACDIHNFYCENEFNKLYFESTKFEIRTGDLLAAEEVRTIFVDNSELEKPISSIFEICKCEDQDDPIFPQFNGEKIKICLKKEIYDLYYEFRDFNNGVLRRYATGIIVYPVLVEAIKNMRADESNENSEEYSEYRWYRAIEHKVNSLGINLSEYEEPSTTLANNLLGNISLDALKSFKDTLENEFNSGETEQIGGVD